MGVRWASCARRLRGRGCHGPDIPEDAPVLPNTVTLERPAFSWTLKTKGFRNLPARSPPEA